MRRDDHPPGSATPLPTDEKGRIIPPGNRSAPVETDGSGSDGITGAADTADAKKVRNDPVINEAAAHRAARHRARITRSVRSGRRL